MKKSIITTGILLITILTLGLSVAILLQNYADNPLSELQYDKNAYKILCKADTFSYSGTSYGGTMTKETEAYANLFKSKDAKKVFLNLEKDANMQGKLYALCAFYYLDNEYYNKQVQSYSKSDETVTIMAGCSYFKDIVKNVMDKSNNLYGLDFKSGEIPIFLNSYITNEPISD